MNPEVKKRLDALELRVKRLEAYVTRVERGGEGDKNPPVGPAKGALPG